MLHFATLRNLTFLTNKELMMPHEEYVFYNPILKEVDDSILRMENKIDEMMVQMGKMMGELDNTIKISKENLRQSDEKDTQQIIQESQETLLIAEKILKDIHKSNEILPISQEITHVQEDIEPSINELFINIINELLTKIHNLLERIIYPNNTNLENIPREEEKNEPRRLGFF